MHLWFAIWLFVLGTVHPWANASRVSWRNPHPVGWMHLPPVGETPGWSTPVWLNLELNHGNIWNNRFSMTDRRTGDIYTYMADFEQSSAILELGFALSEKWAFSLEVPYMNRNGGFLDDFIDQFHQLIRSDRFLRHLNDPFNNEMDVETNGEDRLATQYGQGVGGAKLKLKYWLWQWQSWTPGACDCGFALSAQAKFPTQARKFGISSGTNDYSVLGHLGVPLGDSSGVWITGGITKLGANETFAGWPRRDWQQMYELSLDLGFTDHFGFLIQARTESPYLMKEHLDYNYTYTDERARTAERVASGWNSLVHWRGSQAMGLRWLWGEGNSTNLMVIEDWNLGRADDRGDFLYVNNAPDVAFVNQWHFVF